jgi:hypothetical protein
MQNTILDSDEFQSIICRASNPRGRNSDSHHSFSSSFILMAGLFEPIEPKPQQHSHTFKYDFAGTLEATDLYCSSFVCEPSERQMFCAASAKPALVATPNFR